MSTNPLPINEFAAKVRAKYPGSYDSLSDAQLVQKVVDKYPDYRDQIASFSPTQFEQERTPQAGVVQRFVGGLKDSLPSWQSVVRRAAFGGLDPVSDIEAAKNLYSAKSPQDVGGALVGIDNRAMANRAEHGDAAGIIGQTVIPAATALAPVAAEGGSIARGKIGAAIHEPNSLELTPGARSTAQVGGAIVGGAGGGAYGVMHGSPYAAVTGAGSGGLAGYKAGPFILDKAFPSPGVFPGAPFPAAEDFYSARGAEFDAARRQEATLARQQAREGRPVPIRNSPYFDPQAYKAGKAGLTPEQAAAAKAEEQGTGITVFPEPRPTFAGENPNYMASVKRGTLEGKALAGKPGAGIQIQQLGGDVLYSPRGADIQSPNLASLQEIAYGPPQGNPTPFGPNFAYRAHDVGNPSIDLTRPAHATVSPEEAQVYAEGRGALQGAPPQTVSKINLGKFSPEHYELTEGPRGNKWVRFKRPLEPGDFE